MGFCTRCGRDLALDASYCDWCGEPVDQKHARQSKIMNRDYKSSIEQTLKNTLGLEGWPVGVKLIQHLGEIPKGVKEVDEARRHCEMVQDVRRNGSSFFSPPSKHLCKVAAVSLGLMNPTEELRRHQVHELFQKHHRFKTEELLRKYVEGTPKLPRKYAAVLYGPLGSMPIKPDVIVLICDPSQAMKLIQAHQYITGERASFSLGGLFSLCADAVSTPYLKGNINLAIGCEGAREHAGLKDYELSVGFPYEVAEAVTEALQTLAKYGGAKEEHR